MQVEIIPRTEARVWLSKPVSRRERMWDIVAGRWRPGPRRKYATRHPRGAGAKPELVNYGLRNANGKLQAVARIGPAPYGGAPAKAAVGERLAAYTCYLMRLYAAGVTGDGLLAFIQSWLARLPHDLAERGHAKRYLLSLDDPEARLVHGPAGVLTDTPPYSGAIYVHAGALDAGMTSSRRQPTRYVDPDSGELRSIYASGRNLLPELRRRGIRLIHEGAKRRYVFILAPEGSPLYQTYRAALPSWVRHIPGERWVQPRLLFRLLAWTARGFWMGAA